MSDQSSIQWTDATWNPTTGCTKVSPGCANCYIERTPPFRMAHRAFVSGHIPLVLHPDRLHQPRAWRKPRRVFVNSLSDLFHDDVPTEFIWRVFNVMGASSRHQFQVLTKRADRMRAAVSAYYETTNLPPFPNVWLGVSVENQHFADERIPLLLKTPAAVRFLSCEPLLASIDLDRIPWGGVRTRILAGPWWTGPEHGIHWVIVGGESGPKSRPFDLAWARSIVDQCREARVPCFVKQLGAMPFDPDRIDEKLGYVDLKDRKGGDPSEWPEDMRVREFPR